MDEVDWYHGDDYNLLDVQGGGTDLSQVKIEHDADLGLTTVSGIVIHGGPLMDDDPQDEMKTGLEARLPWWFWPVSLVVAVALAAAWAWSQGREE